MVIVSGGQAKLHVYLHLKDLRIGLNYTGIGMRNIFHKEFTGNSIGVQQAER